MLTIGLVMKTLKSQVVIQKNLMKKTLAAKAAVPLVNIQAEVITEEMFLSAGMKINLLTEIEVMPQEIQGLIEL